jgi:hypothetical protein
MRAVDGVRSRWPEALLEVSYERLCKQPAQTLARISRFLQVPYSASPQTTLPVMGSNEREMHPLVDLAPQGIRARAWRDELPSWQRRTVELLTTPELERRDYQALDAVGSPTAILARAWLTHLVATPLYLARRVPRHLLSLQHLPAWLRFRRARRQRREAMERALD